MVGLFAAFTGDFVGSAAYSADDLTRAREGVTAAAGRLSRLDPAATVSPVHFFRGDGFQLVLDQPRLALRAALLLQTRLFALSGAQARICVGLGPLAGYAPDNVATSMGEALVLSGRGLEAMPRAFRLHAALRSRRSELEAWTPPLFALCSAVLGKGTRRQNEIIAVALERPDRTQRDIAESLDPPVTQQTIAAALQAGVWGPIAAMIEAFESVDWSDALFDATHGKKAI